MKLFIFWHYYFYTCYQSNHFVYLVGLAILGRFKLHHFHCFSVWSLYSQGAVISSLLFNLVDDVPSKTFTYAELEKKQEASNDYYYKLL
jgi:hypothetical protein